MSDQIRRPTADETLYLYPVPGPDNYTGVDEEVADDNDYNYLNHGDGQGYDAFSHSAFSIEESGTIFIVKQIIRAKRTDEDNVMKVWGVLILKDDDGTQYYQTSHSYGAGVWFLTTEWVDYEVVWTSNPCTGLPWTKDQVEGVGDRHLWAEGYGVGLYE